MLRERIAIVTLLLPFGLWIIADGNWPYIIAVAAILGLAAAEYAKLFRRCGLRPSLPLLVAGVLSLCLSRAAFGFLYAHLFLAALALLSMLWHIVDYERGAPQSATDFAVTLSGIFYLGWVGSYFISLRFMPDGVWWILLALPVVWIADSAAYIIGRRIGRHKLVPRLSPNKSWEGYFSGVIIGGASGFGIARLWQIGAGAGATITAKSGLIVGLIIAIFAPLGDLGISMIKRQVKSKDSGSFIPGHGGALDRIDSWIWAVVFGYYVISLMAG